MTGAAITGVLGLFFILCVIGGGIWILAFMGSPSDRLSEGLKNMGQRLYSYGYPDTDQNTGNSSEDTPARLLGDFGEGSGALPLAPPPAVVTAAPPLPEDNYQPLQPDKTPGAAPQPEREKVPPATKGQPASHPDYPQMTPHKADVAPTAPVTATPFVLEPLNLSTVNLQPPLVQKNAGPAEPGPGPGSISNMDDPLGSLGTSGTESQPDAANNAPSQPADGSEPGQSQTKTPEIDIPGGAL